MKKTGESELQILKNFKKKEKPSVKFSAFIQNFSPAMEEALGGKKKKKKK
jgi:hypothetical protein